MIKFKYAFLTIDVIQQVQEAKSECSDEHANSSCTSKQSSFLGKLSELNEILESFSYVGGYTPTQADLSVTNLLAEADVPLSKYPHISRWYSHISSFSEAERGIFPEAKDSIKFSTIKSRKVRKSLPWILMPVFIV